MDNIAWVSLALGAFAVLIAGAVFLSFSSVRRRLLVLQGRAGRDDIVTAVSRQIDQVGELRKQFEELSSGLDSLTIAFKDAVQRVCVYRYDAFEDMGGKLSFSAAFLDAKGNGVVISCINGRQEARSYAKPIEAAQSAYNLSPEEQEAIRRALSGETT